MDVQQLIPLPEAESYQVSVRAKEAEKREARKSSGSDWSVYDLIVAGKLVGPRRNARRLVLTAVRALLGNGIDFKKIVRLLPRGEKSFISVEGNCDGADFAAKAAQLKSDSGKPIDFSRYFCLDDELFKVENKTYALTKHWTHDTALPTVAKMVQQFSGVRDVIHEG